jgi:hypothetical protein
MTLLGKIGSAVGSALDAGSIVKDAVNTILPKELEIVGDIAGAAVDLAERNPVGAAKHALEALRDLPQAAKAVQDALGSAAGDAAKSVNGHGGGWRGTPQFEPRPPARGPQVNVTVNGGQVSISINETALRWPRLQAAIDSVWLGAVHAGGPCAPPSPGVGSGPSGYSAAPLASSSAATSASASATSTHGAINSTSDIKNMSDADFMSALRDGNISPDVAKDPAAMLQLQERMNRITQMNQLMSQLLAAMHQMATSTIQNIRA